MLIPLICTVPVWDAMAAIRSVRIDSAAIPKGGRDDTVRGTPEVLPLSYTSRLETVLLTLARSRQSPGRMPVGFAV
jgi:hypothetical protein